MAIDLEHFPTYKVSQRMMSRVSPIYEKSYVGKWLFQVMGMEMEEAWDLFEELRQQPFPERTTWAIEYWERRYAIIPKPTDDLETRRRNIVMKRSIHLPMNPARMENMINGMTGGNTTLTENVDDYTFSITIDDPGPNMGTESVVKTVKEWKPSHQTFEYHIMVHAKEAIPIRTGGLMTSLVRMAIPELQDQFNFEATARLGGQLAHTIRHHVPELADTLRFSSTLQAGGAISPIIRNTVPELADDIHMGDTLQTGGQFTHIAHHAVPELADDIRLQGTLQAGGQVAANIRHAVPELADDIHLQGTLQAGGAVGSSTTVPVPAIPDEINLACTGRTGGAVASVTTVHVPELPE